MEAALVEGRAHEALLVGLLRLRIAPRVEPLADAEGEWQRDLALVGRVIHDEAVLRLQGGAEVAHHGEGVPKRMVVEPSRPKAPRGGSRLSCLRDVKHLTFSRHVHGYGLSIEAFAALRHN